MSASEPECPPAHIDNNHATKTLARCCWCCCCCRASPVTTAHNQTSLCLPCSLCTHDTCSVVCPVHSKQQAKERVNTGTAPPQASTAGFRRRTQHSACSMQQLQACCQHRPAGHNKTPQGSVSSSKMDSCLQPTVSTGEKLLSVGKGCCQATTAYWQRPHNVAGQVVISTYTHSLKRAQRTQRQQIRPHHWGQIKLHNEHPCSQNTPTQRAAAYCVPLQFTCGT